MTPNTDALPPLPEPIGYADPASIRMMHAGYQERVMVVRQQDAMLSDCGNQEPDVPVFTGEQVEKKIRAALAAQQSAQVPVKYQARLRDEPSADWWDCSSEWAEKVVEGKGSFAALEVRALYTAPVLSASPQAPAAQDAQVPVGTYEGRYVCPEGTREFRGLLAEGAEPPKPGTPLYASPQRAVEPLTDEQIDGLRGLDTASRVRFYEHDFYVLSNFSAFTLIWKGIRFDTSEAAYHWEKFTGDSGSAQLTRHFIQTAPSAHEAFKIAERNKEHRRPDWDEVKVGIMLDILREKAKQHEYVRRKLLATGDRELVEDSWRDDFWGWGPNRDGKNMLGTLWMQVRAELREQDQ